LDRLLQVGGGFGSSTTSRRRIWIVYHKPEEDLDRLLQVGGGPSTVHRRAPISADYWDFINNALPLSSGLQGLMAPPTWSGRLGHRKGTESSKLLGSAHPFAPSTWLGEPGYQKGKKVLQATRFSPLLCAINPDNLSGLERFQKGRTLGSSMTIYPREGTR
jgi:hypothetical protein